MIKTHGTRGRHNVAERMSNNVKEYITLIKNKWWRKTKKQAAKPDLHEINGQ